MSSSSRVCGTTVRPPADANIKMLSARSSTIFRGLVTWSLEVADGRSGCCVSDNSGVASFGVPALAVMSSSSFIVNNPWFSFRDPAAQRSNIIHDGDEIRRYNCWNLGKLEQRHVDTFRPQLLKP